MSSLCFTLTLVCVFFLLIIVSYFQLTFCQLLCSTDQVLNWNLTRWGWRVNICEKSILLIICLLSIVVARSSNCNWTTHHDFLWLFPFTWSLSHGLSCSAQQNIFIVLFSDLFKVSCVYIYLSIFCVSLICHTHIFSVIICAESTHILLTIIIIREKFKHLSDSMVLHGEETKQQLSFWSSYSLKSCKRTR